MPSRTRTASPQYVPDVLLDRDLQRDGFRRVEGTLVFADLSDFTPLTERFARKGRVGSETLTDVINALFAPMLDVALTAGGDLLKFGGDALLIAFTGERHPSAALHVALAMRDELRRSARREKVRVGMSIGVASGGIDLHVVGRRNRELIVIGPTVDRCLELETAAGTGQILVDLTPDQLLDAGATTSPGATGVELLGLVDLRDPPIDLRAPRRRARSSGLLLDPLIAAAVDDGAPAEHRRAGIAFVKFVAPASEETTEAALNGRLGDLVDITHAICAEFDVALLNIDVNHSGGKLTLASGVPLTTGDDSDRLLRCVTRLVASPEATALGAAIGVHGGHVFAGPVGSTTRRCYTVMGDAVNVAARVMARAEPGQVLATVDVIDRTRGGFDVGEIEQFAVKGKSTQISAAAVRGPSGTSAPRVVKAELWGRDAELAEIVGAIGAAATTGCGAAIEISGPAGIGKTRLAAAATVAIDLPVVVLECGRYLANSPYGPIIEAFRRLLGGSPSESEAELGRRLATAVKERAPHLTPWIPFLAIPLGIDLPDTPETGGIGAEFRQTRVHRVFGEFIQSMLAAPGLMLLEDAHWLDTASGELLTSVSGELLKRGWVFLSTRRPDDGGWTTPDPDVWVELQPLAEPDARRLAIDVAGDARLPEHVTRVLVDRSLGNPLFLEELVGAVTAGADPETLPDRVEVLIEVQIDRLPAHRRLLLRTCAVLGARFDADLLHSVVGGTALDGLDPFLVRDGDEIRFRHALYRDTAYVTLPDKERVRLHLAAATAIEARAGDDHDEWAEILSVHLFAARDYRRAWPQLRIAAERAKADLAPYEASRFLERSIECIGHLRGDTEAAAARPEIDEELGLLYDTLTQFTAAEASFRRARRHATDAATRSRLRGLEGRVARSNRSLTTAARRYRLALEEAPDDAHGVRAELCVGLAAVLERQGRHHQKLELLHTATRSATKAGDVATLAHAHLVLGNTYGDLGTDRADRHLTTALVLFEQLEEMWGVASARNNLGVEAYFRGEWTTALDHYSAALDAYRQIGDESNSAMALTNIGEIHSDQGHWELALAEFEEARRIWHGSGLGVAFVDSNLGRLRCRRGELDEAAAAFDAARSGLERAAAGGYLDELEARVAVFDLQRGVAADAYRRATSVLGRADVELQPTVRCQLERTVGLAASGLDRSDEAGAHLSTAMEVAESSHADYERATTLMAIAAHTNDEFAVRQADAIFEELGVTAPARRAW